MTRFKLFIFLLFFQILFSQKQFVINGSVSPHNDGKTVYYYYHNIDQVILDSTIIKNGKFYLKGKISYPTLFNVYKKSNGDDLKENFSFFISDGTTKLDLNYYDFRLSKTLENKHQIEFLKYNNYKNPIWDRLDASNLLREKLEEKNLLSYDKNNDFQIQKLDSLQNIIEEQSIIMDVIYAKSNPSSFVALYNLYFDLGRSLGRSKYKEIKSSFDLMSVDIKSSSLGVYINDKLNTLESNNTLGRLAINFESSDFYGNTFYLSHFFGKNIIILDFWASWCAPCKLQLPFFRKLYNQYKDYGLEIISVSKDTKENAWRTTVEKEKMIWINTLISNKTKKIMDDYLAQAIPVTIIIDKNGKIIGRWTGFSQESNVEIEKIISENLK